MVKQVPLIKTGKTYGASVGASDNHSPKMSARQVNNEFDKRNQVRDRSFKDNFSVLCLAVGILLSVSLIKSLMGGSSVTFGGLLEYLSNAPSINMSLTTFEVIAPLAWEGEILGSIAYFINIFITIFNVLLFAFKGLGQVVVYLVYFIRFLF